MVDIKFVNDARSTLAVSIGAGSSSLAVRTGDGALFPSLAGGEYFYITLQKATGVREILKVEARSGDTLSSLTRAQEGTAALAFAAGDKVELRLTVGALQDKFNQELILPAFYGVDTGVADVYLVIPRLFPSSYTAGLVVLMEALNANTGAATIDVSSLGVQTIVRNDGTALQANDIIAGGEYWLVHDGTDFLLTNPNPPPAFEMPAGTALDFWGVEASVPSGWLLCDGDEYLSNTFLTLALLLILNQSNFGLPPTAVGDFTADSGTDILTLSSHGMSNGDLVHIVTDDTLPANLNADTIYYIINGEADINEFQLSLTLGGGPLDFSNNGTGIHSIHNRFTVPDLRGRVALGKDDMGVGSADRVINAEADLIGGSAGAEDHQLTTPELSSHTHGQRNRNNSSSGVAGTGGVTTVDNITVGVTAPSGSDNAHNNMQPYLTTNKIIKT